MKLKFLLKKKKSLHSINTIGGSTELPRNGFPKEAMAKSKKGRLSTVERGKGRRCG